MGEAQTSALPSGQTPARDPVEPALRRTQSVGPGPPAGPLQGRGKPVAQHVSLRRSAARSLRSISDKPTTQPSRPAAKQRRRARGLASPTRQMRRGLRPWPQPATRSRCRPSQQLLSRHSREGQVPPGPSMSDRICGRSRLALEPGASTRARSSAKSAWRVERRPMPRRRAAPATPPSAVRAS